MKPENTALLEALGAVQYSVERGQLLWPCPLTQEQVEQLAPILMARLECQLGTMEWGADRQYWSITFEGTLLDLHFEALCETLWLQSPTDEREGHEVIAFLAQQLGAEHV